jgi:nucleoid-associated protein YgaU
VVSLVDRGAPLARKPGASLARKPPSKTAAGGTGAPSGQPRTVVVRPGDSLWAIAQKLLGPRASAPAVERKLVAIWNLNAIRIGTGDPNLIFPGTHLRLP